MQEHWWMICRIFVIRIILLLVNSIMNSKHYTKVIWKPWNIMQLYWLRTVNYRRRSIKFQKCKLIHLVDKLMHPLVNKQYIMIYHSKDTFSLTSSLVGEIITDSVVTLYKTHRRVSSLRTLNIFIYFPFQLKTKFTTLT